MDFSPAGLAETASWIATGLGFGLWLWGWFAVREPLKRQRMHDCGVVLVFSGILARVATRGQPLSPWEWALWFIGPLFIAAALVRLSRTQ